MNLFVRGCSILKYVKQTFLLLLLLQIALLGIKAPAFAEQLDNSVKSYIENRETSDDNKPTEKVDIEEKNAPMTSENESEQVGLNAWDFIKMIFATVFVIVLLYFLLKFINKKSKSFKSTQLVENLGGTALGTNRSIQIIKVGNQILVVGVGENIQLLKEISEPEEYNQIIADYNNRMDQLIQPSDIVTKVFQRTKSTKVNKNEGNSPKFQSLLKQQLEDITKDRKKLYEEMEKKGSDER